MPANIQNLLNIKFLSEKNTKQKVKEKQVNSLSYSRHNMQFWGCVFDWFHLILHSQVIYIYIWMLQVYLYTVLHFPYPFICLYAYTLFPNSKYHKLCSYKHGYLCTTVIWWFYSFRKIPGRGIPGSNEISTNFLGIFTLVFVVVVLVCILATKI